MQRICVTENRKAFIEIGDDCGPIEITGPNEVGFSDKTINQIRSFDAKGNLFITKLNGTIFTDI